MTTTAIFKCNKNSTLFDAQNAGNCIFKLLDFRPLGEGGLAASLVVSQPPIIPSIATYN